MMINKRLIHMVPESNRFIWKQVAYQWIGLLMNIIVIFIITTLLQQALVSEVSAQDILLRVIGIVVAIAIRAWSSHLAAKMSYLAGKEVKKVLREKVYRKLLSIGSSYANHISTSEVVQVGAEGVEQLEVYFGRYLPQLYYSLLAPITLFVVLAFVNFKAPLVLLICVPLIPASIIAVQKIAKRLLSKYWTSYVTLGDSFLENLQGLTTLKIYQADGKKHVQMNKEAENFRKITMKVLTMQLNSVTIMDLIAYGGAALGIIIAILEFRAGNVSFAGVLAIILLSSEFFIPLRLLGSFFHIAMNGMAASAKIFRILDTDVKALEKIKIQADNAAIEVKNVSFSYDEDREILKDVSLSIPQNGFISIVGESGSGKSTITSLLTGKQRVFKGDITIGSHKLANIHDDCLLEAITLVHHRSYVFKGTVRENLQMGNEKASDDALLAVLKQVNLYDFIMSQDGLDTLLQEQGSNFSGGQKQRLCLARALLHDSPIYIFDEATSNIDAESEHDILQVIHSMAKQKTILFITHRLSSVEQSDCIYVIDQGSVVEQGTFNELIQQKGTFAHLYEQQAQLEAFGKGCAHEEEK